MALEKTLDVTVAGAISGSSMVHDAPSACAAMGRTPVGGVGRKRRRPRRTGRGAHSRDMPGKTVVAHERPTAHGRPSGTMQVIAAARVVAEFASTNTAVLRIHAAQTCDSRVNASATHLKAHGRHRFGRAR
jgi:hypothetical protein